MPSAEVIDVEVVIASIARRIVNQPDFVQLHVRRVDDATLMTLSVHPRDVPVILGPGGRTIRSLRTILAALARRSDQRVSLELQTDAD